MSKTKRKRIHRIVDQNFAVGCRLGTANWDKVTESINPSDSKSIASHAMAYMVCDNADIRLMFEDDDGLPIWATIASDKKLLIQEHILFKDGLS